MIFQDIIVTISSSVKPIHFKNISNLYYFDKSKFINICGFPYVWICMCRLKSGLGTSGLFLRNSIQDISISISSDSVSYIPFREFYYLLSFACLCIVTQVSLVTLGL